MTDALREMAARPKRYENVDGTSEMYFGWMIFAMMLMGYLGTVAETRGLAGYLLLTAGVLLPFLLVGAGVIRAVKKHVTYPRTGYVARRRITREDLWKTMLFGAGLFAAAAALARLVPFLQRNQESGVLRGVMVFVFWVPYAIFALSMSKEHQWKRYTVLVMAAGLLAVALLVPGGTEQLSRPVMLLSALTWLGSGAATLVIYIRHTHAPVGEG